MSDKFTMGFEEFREKLIHYAKMVINDDIPALRHGLIYDVTWLVETNQVCLVDRGHGFMVIYDGKGLGEAIEWSRPESFDSDLVLWWNKYRLYMAGYYDYENGFWRVPQAIRQNDILYYGIGMQWERNDGLPVLVSSSPSSYKQFVPYVDDFETIWQLDLEHVQVQ